MFQEIRKFEKNSTAIGLSPDLASNIKQIYASLLIYIPLEIIRGP